MIGSQSKVELVSLCVQVASTKLEFYLSFATRMQMPTSKWSTRCSSVGGQHRPTFRVCIFALHALAWLGRHRELGQMFQKHLARTIGKIQYFS